MAVNHSIRSTIIDLKKDTPKGSDTFFIDSNVWYWMTYAPASHTNSPHQRYQIQEYPNYIKSCLDANASLYHCVLSLSEVSNLIEKAEHGFYCQSVEDISPKEYRHNLCSERSRVVAEIKSVWGQVESISSPLGLTIDEKTSKKILANIDQAPLDCFDSLFIEFMEKNGVNKIITDDKDFACTSDLKVFTANRNTIIAARNQGKLEDRLIS